MSGYISKDFAHIGAGLPFEPERVWKGVPYSVRKNINRAISEQLSAERVAGEPEHIETLRAMWYDPEDPNMPAKLSDKEYMFIANDRSGNPIGATILLPVGNHLFLNNLAGSVEGKRMRVQDFLLWHIVNYFKGSAFKYLDVGVSYRPSLYRFFSKWRVISYPVIFNKPELNLRIKKEPFTDASFTCRSNEDVAIKTIQKIKELTGISEITFVPDEKHVRIIYESIGDEFNDRTFHFPNLPLDGISAVDLRSIFPVQFGWLLFGRDITDTNMWNEYHCLDLFKRNLVLTQIYDYIDNIVDIIKQRNKNFLQFKTLFSLDDIVPLETDENIKSLFYFANELNPKYHSKLVDFEIEHCFDVKTNAIGLPIHQNLNEEHINYIYGIFRGVLNLCSDWEHTDKYGSFIPISQ